MKDPQLVPIHGCFPRPRKVRVRVGVAQAPCPPDDIFRPRARFSAQPIPAAVTARRTRRRRSPSSAAKTLGIEVRDAGLDSRDSRRTASASSCPRRVRPSALGRSHERGRRGSRAQGATTTHLPTDGGHAARAQNLLSTPRSRSPSIFGFRTAVLQPRSARKLFAAMDHRHLEAVIR